MHDFITSLNIGNSGSHMVADYLWRRHSWKCTPATKAEQWRGIDWIATTEQRDRVAVEVKTDHRSRETGRLAIEVMSNDVTGREGWAYTSEADWLLIYVPHLAKVFWFKPETLQWVARHAERLAENSFGRYSIGRAKNDGYATVNVCIPIDAAALVASCIEPIR